MERRVLGRTSIPVAQVSLGCVEIGMRYGPPGAEPREEPRERESIRLLNHALDRGVNLLDTAAAYGRSEEVIGRAVAHRRSEFTLVTKVEVQPEVPTERIPLVVSASLDRSLRRLRTENVDILLLHSASAEVIAAGDAIAALESERLRGRCSWIGVSTYGSAAAEGALADGRFDCVQLAYSALDRRLEPIIRAFAAADVGVVARSTLLKGVLTERAEFLPAALASLKEAVHRIGRIASAAGMTLPELAARFVASNEDVPTLLVGTASLREVDEVVGWVERGPLPRDVLAAVRRVLLEDEGLLDPSRWPPNGTP